MAARTAEDAVANQGIVFIADYSIDAARAWNRNGDAAAARLRKCAATDFVEVLGVDEIQGYVIAKPMDAEASIAREHVAAMTYLDSYFRIAERAPIEVAVSSTHNPWLVILSVCISTLASLVAMSVVERIRGSITLLARVLLIAIGGLALGVGIWAMHFIGMLAFQMPMGVGYDPLITIASVVPGLIAGTIAIVILGRTDTPSAGHIIGAGVIVGAGIGAMHYMGMAAMTMAADLLYDIPLVSLSVVVAATLATASLYALFFLRASPRLHAVGLPISAVIMGCAVAGMHYTAMAAAIFVPSEMHHAGHDAMDAVVLTILITIFVALLFSAVFAVVFASQQIQTKLTLQQEIVKANELTKALREAQLSAENANEAKSRFLATMSHEIRTPMNAVIGMIDVMRESDLKEDQREIADVIRDSSFSLLQIINDILDFSKIEATGVQLERHPLSVLKIVESVCDALAWSARQRGIRLVVSFGNYDLRPVYGDALRLRQILFNLVGNAIKFTETTAERTGEVKLTVNTFEAPGGRVRLRLEISDNGIGISEEARDALFKPFVQAESSTTRKYGGTGLGLSIVVELLKAMNGTIDLQSEIGAGSTFIVEIETDHAPAGGLLDVDVPDLTGVEAWIAAGSPEHRDAALKMLNLMGAKTAEIQLDAAIAGGASGPFSATADRDRIALIVVDDETDSLRTGLRRVASNHKVMLRFVTIRSDRPRDAERSSDTVFVEASPLKFTTFARAVAVAAGRSSPAVPPVLLDQPDENIARQSRDEAIQRGTLVLVAEDNRNNQLVIGRQLSLLGYACDIASDGAEALALLAKENYGIVLTDCHMPIMDGFELTRHIRESERNTDRHQKIIAITANALQGEAEHCIASGMDFYLSKPLELSKLAETLKNWLPLGRKDAVGAANGMPVPNQGPDPIDVSVIARLYGSDDPGLIALTVRDFVDISITDAEAFFAAVRSDDRHAIRNLGHKLKATAKAVGAAALAQACEQAEANALTAPGPADTDIFRSVEPEFRRTYRFAEDYLARMENAVR